ALVAAQAAKHAQRGRRGRCAEEVLPALALLVLPVGAETGGGGEARLRVAAIESPAQIDAGIVAVQPDHAAAAARRGMRGRHDGLVLHELAVAAVGHRLDAMAAAAERMLPRHAELALLHRLARVEAARRRRRL